MSGLPSDANEDIIENMMEGQAAMSNTPDELDEIISSLVDYVGAGVGSMDKYKAKQAILNSYISKAEVREKIQSATKSGHTFSSFDVNKIAIWREDLLDSLGLSEKETE